MKMTYEMKNHSQVKAIHRSRKRKKITKKRNGGKRRFQVFYESSKQAKHKVMSLRHSESLKVIRGKRQIST
jgi:hypothetical protein